MGDTTVTGRLSYPAARRNLAPQRTYVTHQGSKHDVEQTKTPSTLGCYQAIKQHVEKLHLVF